jgi:hypothetical protein
MAITIRNTSPETTEPAPDQPPSRSRTTVLGWAAVLAAGTATAVLVVAALAPDTHDQAGLVQDPAGSRQACQWTTGGNEMVFPAPGIGGPPTPGSILIFESCDGRLTGHLAWLNLAPDRSQPGGGDSGLVNPWAAGNAAVERYLCELNPECDPAEP